MTLSLDEIEHLNLVKQGNPLIDSLYRMEASEQKIILLASKLVNQMGERGIPFDEKTEIILTADQFAKEYGLSRQLAFYTLCEAKNTIYKRSFTYFIEREDGTKKLMRSRWLHSTSIEASASEYDEFSDFDDVELPKESAEFQLAKEGKSEVTLMFAPAVIPHIYNIKTAYTLLDINEVGRLKSKYAIRLYKVLMKWRRANFQPTFTVDEIRTLYGLKADEYTVMSDFKKRVINISVAQISKHTGFIGLKAVAKKGRSGKIMSFSFEYDRYDNETINVTPATKTRKEDKFVVYQMTDEQIKMFSSSLAVNASKGEPGYSELGKLVIAGQKTEVLAERIAGDFRKRLFAPYLDVLKLAGFTPNKFNKTPVVGSTGENTPTDSGVESNESEETTQKPFKLPDSLYAKYVAKGGKLTRDQILEVAMAENVKPVRVMLDNGINVLAT